MNFLLKVALVIFFSLAGSAWAQLTPEQQVAKDKGLMFYQQHKGISAVPLLRIAAEAGDSEAQYFLAETLRLNAMHITAEAQKWYEAAAEQGEVYAMLRLSGKGDDLCVAMGNCPADQKTPIEWLMLARETAGARAAQGDAVAMYQMNNATADLAWLEKAAEAGYGEAQWLLANRYKEGRGTFIWPGSREEAVEKWFKASAESGYPPGMMAILAQLYERGDYQAYFDWNKRAAETGFINGIYGYSLNLLDKEKIFNIEPDPIKSYGLMSLIAELDGGGDAPLSAREELEEMARLMTPAQIEQAKVFAEKWRKTHPPLSFFVNKYGF
nr:tetratricopeptide repeat protein [uncultured Pseudomonas sp.]